MKFNFNETFLKSLNELLEKREETLKLNFVHVDDLDQCQIQDQEERLSSLEEIIENSEIEYKDFNDYVEKEEILEYIESEIAERNFVTSSDLEEAFENSHLESRINDLENGSFAQDQNDENSQRIKTLESDYQELKERLLTLVTSSELHEAVCDRIDDLNMNDNISERIKDLEQENQDLKERLLTLENFLLKTFKEFSND